MNTKTTRIVSIVLMAIPVLVLIAGGTLKILGAEPETVVDFLTKAGFGPYLVIMGLAELVIAALLIYSKTRKIGFLLASCYLSGALSQEISGAQPLASVVFLMLLWVGMFLQHRDVFISLSKQP